MQKFATVLKERLQVIVGKEASLRANNCIRIILKGGKEYWATVTQIESDFFVIRVSYDTGGSDKIAVSFGEVGAFSLE